MVIGYVLVCGGVCPRLPDSIGLVRGPRATHPVVYILDKT